MDISELIITWKWIVSLVKEIKDLKNVDKEDIQQKIDVLEKTLKKAEIEFADKLGYPLCKHHFPPEIMLSIGYDNEGYTEQFKCQKCGNIFPGSEPPMPDRHSNL